jgi:hypothetical protein
MSWNTFHNRGETLRVVVDTVNDRRDGVLPVSVPGVAENFADELDLVGALQLKWHARLSGNIERAMAGEPMDLETAVATAWRVTAEQMPGVRLVIDRAAERPENEGMERAMIRARDLERARLAIAAGLANSEDAAAVAAGRRVEQQAREALDAPKAPLSSEPVPGSVTEPAPGPVAGASTESFVDRIKAALAA